MATSEVIGRIWKKSGHEVEWTIEDFFSYTGERYHSPDFTISGTEWFLSLIPKSETAKQNPGWISLYLSKSGDNESPPVGASYTVCVKKSDGTIEQHAECSWVFGNGSSFGYPKFLERAELQRRKSELVPSDSLTLTCILRTEWYFESPSSLDDLSRNFADLFTSKKDSDASLVVQGKEFSVHKLILSARSPVLAAMFETDMKEKRTGIVEIEDCDPEAFEEFLTYLYSGKVVERSKNAMELYKISDKYDVPDLKTYCRLSIMVSLSVANVLDAVMLGLQFDEAGLILKAKEFFNQNFTKIIPNAKWDAFLGENTVVANELLKNVVISKAWKDW